MAKKTYRPLENGLYVLDTGYKGITVGNAAEVLDAIEQQLDRIRHGDYNRSERTSYVTASHGKKASDAVYQARKNGKNFRREEWICKRTCDRSLTFDTVGKIVDYQVPLKHKRDETTDGLGKIDLLAQNETVAYMLELKAPTGTEHPLKAVMEIYTYWKQLHDGDGIHKPFLTQSALSGNVTELRPAIVLYEESPVYRRLEAEKDRMKALMDALGVTCFLAENSDDDVIVKLKAWT